MVRQHAVSSLVAFYCDPEPLLHFNFRKGLSPFLSVRLCSIVISILISHPGWGTEPPSRCTGPNVRGWASALAALLCCCETDTATAAANSLTPTQIQRPLLKIGPR